MGGNRLWEASMVLNRVCFAAFGVMVLAWSGPSAAQQYRAGEFLNLDLSRAVLSPKPLGPAASFAPGPLDVTVDRGNNAAQAGAELLVDPKTVAAATVHAENNSALKNSTPKNSTPKSALRTAASGIRAAHVRTAERSVPAQAACAGRASRSKPRGVASPRDHRSGLALQVGRHLQLEAIKMTPS